MPRGLMDLDEKLINTRIVFQGQYLSAEERTVELPDGRIALREIVRPPNAVGILAIDREDHVYLVRQYRTALEAVTLEIPAGIIDLGESPEETAGRECAEEIGFAPGAIEFLFAFYHSVGFSTGRIQVFLATDLQPTDGLHADPDERLERVRIPLTDFYSKATSGEIVDSKSLLAALWYRQHRKSQ